MLAFLNKFLTGFYNPDNVDFLAYLAVIGMIPLDPTPTGIWLYKAFKKWWTKEDVYIYIYIYLEISLLSLQENEHDLPAIYSQWFNILLCGR